MRNGILGAGRRRLGARPLGFEFSAGGGGGFSLDPSGFNVEGGGNVSTSLPSLPPNVREAYATNVPLIQIPPQPQVQPLRPGPVSDPAAEGRAHATKFKPGQPVIYSQKGAQRYGTVKEKAFYHPQSRQWKIRIIAQDQRTTDVVPASDVEINHRALAARAAARAREGAQAAHRSRAETFRKLEQRCADKGMKWAGPVAPKPGEQRDEHGCIPRSGGAVVRDDPAATSPVTPPAEKNGESGDEGGIPTWVYVAGGLAVVGGVYYFATRR